MKESNPFVIHGYSTPDTFCDREAETEKCPPLDTQMGNMV